MLRKITPALVLVLLSGALVWIFQDAVLDLLDRGREAAFGPAEQEAAVPTAPKTLYFADAEGDLLLPYRAEVETGEDDVETLRNLLEALLAGPREEGYAPILPRGTKLRVAFPGAGKVAYVDFDKTFRDAHPGGVWAESITAYGVAATVVANFPGVFERVVLLIEGQEAQSVAGALALTGPLGLREEWISKRPPPRVDTAPPAPSPSAQQDAPPAAVGLPKENLPPVGGGPVEAVGVPKEEADAPVGAPKQSP